MTDDAFDQIFTDRVLRDGRTVLGRQHDRVDAQRPIAVVLHGDLRLSVRTQIVKHASTAGFGEPADELVREHDRQRHQLIGFGTRIAKHQSLIAGAAGVDALSDITRLFVNRRQHRTGFIVEPVLRARVSDVLDYVAHDFLKIDVTAGGNFAGDNRESRRDQCLARDPGDRVLRENRIEDAD